MTNRFSVSLFVWLIVVWLLLWGSVRIGTALAGVAVALAVLLLFPLPTRSLPLIRPVRLLVLAVFVAIDLLTSAFRTALEVVRFGPWVRSAVVAVPALSDQDHVIATAAGAISLTPDTFVIQIDREQRVLYIYALGVRSVQQADRTHDQALTLQVRVVRALAPDDEADTVVERVQRLRRGRLVSPERSPGSPPGTPLRQRFPGNRSPGSKRRGKKAPGKGVPEREPPEEES